MGMGKGIWIAGAAVLLFLASCVADSEMLKRQGEAARNVGEAYMAMGDYTSALRELLKAEKLNPKDPFLQNDLGLVYMAKEKLDQAVVHFKETVRLKPDYADAWNNLGSAYLGLKKWDDAIMSFEKITGNLLYATPHFPLANLGWSYYNKKDYRKAEAYYLKALEIVPGFVMALRDLGRTYMAMGKATRAVAVLEKGVEKTPRFAEIHFYLGQAYRLSGDRVNALHSFRKAKELSPDSVLARDVDRAIQRLNN